MSRNDGMKVPAEYVFEAKNWTLQTNEIETLGGQGWREEIIGVEKTEKEKQDKKGKISFSIFPPI